MKKIFSNQMGTSRVTDLGDAMVLCKKNIGSFKYGKYYEIESISGNPQASFEAGEKFMSSDFFNTVRVITKWKIDINGIKTNSTCEFLWRGRSDINKTFFTPKNLGYFQDYFIYDLITERREKLKKLNKTFLSK